MNGVRYEARLDWPKQDAKPLRYVFRFADHYWYPPLAGGLMLVPYSDFVLGDQSLWRERKARGVIDSRLFAAGRWR